jgi:hypothetical protein
MRQQERIERSDDNSTLYVTEYYDGDNKLVATSEREEWHPGTEMYRLQQRQNRAKNARNNLKLLANGSGPMTTAQLTVAVRVIARALLVLELEDEDGEG